MSCKKEPQDLIKAVSKGPVSSVRINHKVILYLSKHII